MAKLIADLSTSKLKRYFQRRQRSVWRRAAWIAEHSRYYPGYEDYRKGLEWHQSAGEEARKELEHRGQKII